MIDADQEQKDPVTIHVPNEDQAPTIPNSTLAIGVDQEQNDPANIPVPDEDQVPTTPISSPTIGADQDQKDPENIPVPSEEQSADTPNSSPMIDADREQKDPENIPVPNEDQSAATPSSAPEHPPQDNGISKEDQAAIDELQRQTELTEAQLKQIEDEQNKIPLVGDKIPFEVILMEYNETDSPDFLNKAKELAETYSHIRQIRGDGNCFYRCLLVAQIELIMKDPNELQRFDQLARGWKKRLIDLDYPDFTTDDFCEFFYTFLDAIKNKTKITKDVFKFFNDAQDSNYLILFMRLITAGYLRENTKDYEDFVAFSGGMDKYCKHEIEPMWIYADHLAAIGLVKALGQPIRVEYMDRSAALKDKSRHYIPADTAEEPKITLLYRPGHYDLIYKN